MEDIYADITKGIRKTKRKTALFLCGSSGSGKTSSLASILTEVNVPLSHVYLNVDDLKPTVKTYSEVRQLAYRAMDDGYNIVWDKTCRNTGDVLSVMNRFHTNGYHVIVALLYVDLSTSISRIGKRSDQPIPEHVIRGIFRELQQKSKRYMNQPFIDEIVLYNNEDSLQLIYQRTKDTVKCISPETKFYFNVSEFC